MNHDAGAGLLNPYSQSKVGNDTIFGWWARYQEAVKNGADAVNGTIGALLEDDGTLAINKVVDEAIRAAPPVEIAAYAPLKGLPAFLDLAKTLALGEHRDALDACGISMTATATPGGSGALFLAAANFANRGDKVLLRDRHWGPYKGFLSGCDLGSEVYALLPKIDDSPYPFVDIEDFKAKLASLCSTQDKVMIWLNDPAHNPTGLSLTPAGRMAVLEAVMESASANENVGHTLLLDSAYHLYAEEPHGWSQTILESIEEGWPWTENFLITFALSLSKSHTIYGLRTGALVSIHPDAEVTEKIDMVMGVTGRQTWSAAPRVAQYTVSEMHASSAGGEAWGLERDRLQSLLVNRRNLLKESCEKLNVPLNPTHDGFFAWLEHDDPQKIAEACAEQEVYLVPLTGGVRIGLCAVPLEHIPRVAEALAHALK
ncbi:aminotransferase class I/II-fold pyridoxal phosphate-dependent enzyme [Candidatus Poseidoniaceae archaeon]|nr:aminotransferase class I/II-fold pyridoxal phosphate-dependent enzyme [Candidatus Poseidoniaceae archaeon]